MLYNKNKNFTIYINKISALEPPVERFSAKFVKLKGSKDTSCRYSAFFDKEDFSNSGLIDLLDNLPNSTSILDISQSSTSLFYKQKVSLSRDSISYNLFQQNTAQLLAKCSKHIWEYYDQNKVIPTIIEEEEGEITDNDGNLISKYNKLISLIIYSILTSGILSFIGVMNLSKTF